MTPDEAMTRMVERKGLDVGAVCTAAVHEASRNLRDVELADHFLDAQWWAAMGAWRDVMDADAPIDLVPVEPLASVTLLTNRREEYARREDIMRERHERAVDRRAAELVGEPDPWPHSSPCPEQCDGCGCCIHSTLGCSARDLPDGSLCGGVGCGCEGRS